jgi:hypothetical protein
LKIHPFVCLSAHPIPHLRLYHHVCRYNPNAIRDFRARLLLNVRDEEMSKHIEKLIDKYV